MKLQSYLLVYSTSSPVRGKAYQYVRFMKPKIEEFDHAHISEISFHTTTDNGVPQKLRGTIFGNIDYDNVHKAFDKDLLTFVEVIIGR